MDQNLKPITFLTHTFGCKVNTYDSGLIQKNLKAKGMQAVTGKADVHVLNTCAVTQEASKEALKLVRKIKSKEPLAKIVITGCAAQVDTQLYDQVPGIDLVVANSHKSALPFLIDDLYRGKIHQKVFKDNIFKKEDLEEGGGLEETHTRTFLKIQDGCNSFCTYCVIPFARGKSRSLSVSYLIQKVNDLYQQGVREVVLTGIHIGDYEDNHFSGFRNSHPGKPARLEELCEALLINTKMPRFRVSSLEPVEVSPRLLEIYQDPRMCPHFHMSIQSANDKVLKNMKRQYGKLDVIQSLNQIQKQVPRAFVGMDVIVGFPTESDEDFEDTYLTLADLPWSRLHVFPYSERPGTIAMKLPESVERGERFRRSEKLRDLSSFRLNALADQQIGQIKMCLGLKNTKNLKEVSYISDDYWTIRVPIEVQSGHSQETPSTGFSDTKSVNSAETQASAAHSFLTVDQVPVRIVSTKMSQKGELQLVGSLISGDSLI